MAGSSGPIGSGERDELAVPPTPPASPSLGSSGAPKIVHTPSGLGAPLGGAGSGAGSSAGGSLRSFIPPSSSFPAPPEEAATAAAALRPLDAAGTPGATAPGAVQPPKQIRTFGDRKRHEDSWTRTPNTTGTGAIHVKTFHSKLTDEAMNYLDQQINEWLDAHPQYEVKFSSATIGDFTGKLKEPHVIVQVWV